MTETLEGRTEAAAGLAVWGADTVPGAADVRATLAASGVPAALAAKDPSLWGPDAEPEARIRLGWIDTIARSRELLPQLAELRTELADLDHVVLAGMGGSSLAPEVICRTLDRPLTVLDTTDPQQVRAALADRLATTVVVVSSKSGGTVETDSQRRAYWQAFREAGFTEAETARRMVIVTDPGSSLATTGEQQGSVVILADPDVGGRYSALTAFGLVPATLAGVDVAELLDAAEALLPSLARESDNPALALGAALGAAALGAGGAPVRDKLALVEDGTGIVGIGDWAEQLIAESTGKQGRGLLPVVVEAPTAAGATGDDVLTVTIGGSLPAGAWPGGGVRPHLAVNGPLGAQFLAWEYATAIAGRVLEINPFDQPNVTESKDNTNAILAGGAPPEAPAAVDGAVELYGTDAGTVVEALAEFTAGLGDTGYLAIMAYLDRFGDAAAAQLRPLLATATGRPVTFGWGPRFLHSTGQYHKGGPQVGSFLQITGATTADLAVPAQPYTFGELQTAQAAGDRRALAERDRPVLRLHLTDRAAGLRQLRRAAEQLTQES
ncbi:glucose-6-phosphate isomerase [Natronosporangium hydrolyticum]|uniref:Glucose-6-phosphate isomerase n=1 Tax=Natronosporangium hydrolyticum TaxID=2811111 RepID=A0A895YEH1_9ACTN|nr:glucose-6-phosphate isomerase [Natronosporangium hydrolyticum]QSB12926.1 glucose-6-phosphate isomerase [Natronosporangium hydrolyticum]